MIVGCGALGSKIADSLARQGCEGLVLVDHEQFEPHNVARHVLSSDSILLNKAKATRDHLEQIGLDSDHKHVDIDTGK